MQKEETNRVRDSRRLPRLSRDLTTSNKVRQGRLGHSMEQGGLVETLPASYLRRRCLHIPRLLSCNLLLDFILQLRGLVQVPVLRTCWREYLQAGRLINLAEKPLGKERFQIMNRRGRKRGQ